VQKLSVNQNNDILWHGIVFFFLGGINHEQVNNVVVSWSGGVVAWERLSSFIGLRSNLRTKFHRIYRNAKPIIFLKHFTISPANIAFISTEDTTIDPSHLLYHLHTLVLSFRLKPFVEEICLYTNLCSFVLSFFSIEVNKVTSNLQFRFV